jgi:hypothetical protein
MDKFVGRVRGFGGFVTNLAQFVDRPITEPHPLAWGRPEYDVPETCTRVVTQEQVGTYKEFHSLLVDYSGVLLSCGADSSEAAEAASAVAQIVRPGSWREAGLPAPEKGILDYDTRWYLEMVMRAPEA